MDSSPPPSQSTQPTLSNIRFVPHITPFNRSLHFEVMEREVTDNLILKVGRYTDKVPPTPNRIAFKSKVVSRTHAEIWAQSGQFYIKDTCSSSGTFLNHVRLSSPNQESRPFPLKDGDIIQLGVDYQGGTQDVFRCVKIRLEINRSWQKDTENPFRMKALQTLESLKKNLQGSAKALTGTEDSGECCICLCSIQAFQALFVAPCSHTYHFKCIKPLVLSGPSFVCPLCRTYADLEADVCIDDDLKEDNPQEKEAVKINQPETNPNQEEGSSEQLARNEIGDIEPASSSSRPLLQVNSLIDGSLNEPIRIDAISVPHSPQTGHFADGECATPGNSNRLAFITSTSQERSLSAPNPHGRQVNGSSGEATDSDEMPRSSSPALVLGEMELSNNVPPSPLTTQPPRVASPSSRSNHSHVLSDEHNQAGSPVLQNLSHEEHDHLHREILALQSLSISPNRPHSQYLSPPTSPSINRNRRGSMPEEYEGEGSNRKTFSKFLGGVLKGFDSRRS